MGYGAWDSNAYTAASFARKASGIDDFAYSTTMHSRTPRHAWKADPTLDPKDVKIRESRDSTDHPESTPIAVLFDVTGSMGSVPRTMQKELANLHALLVDKNYVPGPQIMFGAIGDADSDRVPLQVGQFESDNRMDEQLRLIFLEGNGGGQKSESYDLAAWFIARHTTTDAWDKRGTKGYLFLIGDEKNKPVLKRHHVENVLGYDPNEDIDVASLYAELAEKWHVFYILPNMTSYYNDPDIENHWRPLVGNGFIKLEAPEAVCDLIATTIGVTAGTITLNTGLSNLDDIGSAHTTTVGNALARVGDKAVTTAHRSPVPAGL